MHTLLDITKEAAREAGAAVMELYGSTAFERKGDGSPVTEADMRAHNIILSHLEKTQIPILSEEATGISLPYPERLWIIDPIDGTTGFIKRNGEFAVMIGLLERGRPTLGVVYAPASGVMYSGDTHGAFKEKDGVITKLTLNVEPGSPVRFVRSKNHFTPLMESVANSLHAIMIPQGGIGLKAGMIIDNDGDFFFSLGNLGEWDVCAPHAIFEAAGGVVTSVVGNELEYGNPDHCIQKGVIFSHPSCHSLIVRAIKDHM